MARKTFKVRTDPIDKLIDLLMVPCEDFNSQRDNFRGRASIDDRTFFFTGRADGEFLKSIKEAQDKGQLEYVIFSYGTPIAFRHYGSRCEFPVYSSNGKRVGWSYHEWIIDTGGSPSTAKHIARVREALSQISTSVKGEKR